MKMSVQLADAPLRLPYTYSRGHDASCQLLHVQLDDGDHRGRGEGAPFESFFNTPAHEAEAELVRAKTRIERGEDPEIVRDTLHSGPARNALDAALLHLRAQNNATTVATTLGLAPLQPVKIMSTISLCGPEQMRRELDDTADHPLLKVKLGATDDEQRLALVRRHRPDAELVVDVNGGWSIARLTELLPALEEHGVRMVEQPVEARSEPQLASVPHTIPFFADESFTSAGDLATIAASYDGINIKLDKCGGLTNALRIISAATEAGLRIMIGCLPASSLSSAAGFHAAQLAEFVDLDNHFWIRDDCEPALRYRDGRLQPPEPELWG